MKRIFILAFILLTSLLATKMLAQYPIYNIVINEVKGGPGASNFIELYNNEVDAVDISNYTLYDPTIGTHQLSYTFPEGTIMQSGEYVIVQGSANAYAGPAQNFQWTGTGTMTNGFFDLKLKEANGLMVDSVNSFVVPEATWPSTGSFSRELINPNTNNAIKENWCISSVGTGSPGMQNGCYSDIVTGCMEYGAYNYEPLATVAANNCNFWNGAAVCELATPIECNVYYDGLTSYVNTTNDNYTAGVSLCGFDSHEDYQNWFVFEAPADRLVTVETCYPQTTFAVTLQVYRGHCGELYCYESSNTGLCDVTGASQLSFFANAGETYYIRTGTSTAGTFRLHVHCSLADVGCSDPLACNYDAGNNTVGCEYNLCKGCTDINALNYDATATMDDGMCYTTPPKIVINEVCKRSGYLFVELFNAENRPVDISGWVLNDSALMVFPTGTIMPPASYAVVRRNFTPNVPWELTESVRQIFNMPDDFEFSNQNDIVLDDNFNNLIDTVNVWPGFPISTGSYINSTELINPFLDNNDHDNWRITLNVNQYLVMTPGMQNTWYDPLGVTCEDPTACNYNPHLESTNVHCDWTCFWNDPTPDNDASYNPVQLFNGSELSLTMRQMQAGNSATIESCSPAFHDVWFSFNTEDYDSLRVNFTPDTQPYAVPVIGITVYRLVGESIQEIYCSSFDTNWSLRVEDLPGFDHNTTYVFSLYHLSETCFQCSPAFLEIDAVFYRYNCTDPLACNYNPVALDDDGSCEFTSCVGCTNPDACNYREEASIDDGSCCFNRCVELNMTPGDFPEEMHWEILSQADSSMIAEGNYQSSVSLCLSDTCFIIRLTDTALNGWDSARWSMRDEYSILVDTANVLAGDTTYLNICLSEPISVAGCMNTSACNYNPEATQDDGSCTDACGGCTVTWAMNYDPQATFNDGSCLFPPASGTTCSQPIQLFCDAPNFVFTTNVANDNELSGVAQLSCPGVSSQNLQGGQYWFIYTTEVSSSVHVRVEEEYDYLGFASYMYVYKGTCGDFECHPFSYSSSNINFNYAAVTQFYATAGEIYYIRVHNTESTSSGNIGNIHITCSPVNDGCMDETACNYDEQAVVDDGSCDFACVSGCIDPLACNYNDQMLYDDGTCFYNCIYGCLDPLACNYDNEANNDDGSCIYTECIEGCMDNIACNYNSEANIEDDSCNYDCLYGCMEIGACNYNFEAIYDTVNCDYSCYALGCMDPLACNYNAYAQSDDGTCIYTGCISGCTQSSACNFNPEATTEDFSCIYGCTPGCMELGACNYDPQADLENGSCTYPGCSSIYALNYDPLAGCEGTCYFECIGDFDGNGAMDTSDLTALLSAFGCVGNCGSYDLDGNGLVGAQDIQLFMGGYGQNCE